MKKRKLDDNELALRLIISELSLHLCSCMNGHHEEDIYYYGLFWKEEKTPQPQKGDVAIALSSGYEKCNQFTVGSVEEVIDKGLCIRDFKTNNLCNYTYENFLIIPKEKLGYKFKLGKERQIYEALYKEWCSESPAYKFYKFSLVDNHIRWSIREYFKNDEYVVVEFDITDEMSMKEIVAKAFDILDEELKSKEK